MRVGLFVTCLVDLMRPSIGFAAIRLLEAGGAEAYVPSEQTCCGQPGYNSGDREGTKRLAMRVLDQFEACDYLVAPSGSCSGMIKTHYDDVFRDDPASLRRARSLAENVLVVRLDHAAARPRGGDEVIAGFELIEHAQREPLRAFTVAGVIPRLSAAGLLGWHKIGRASCRERV